VFKETTRKEQPGRYLKRQLSDVFHHTCLRMAPSLADHWDVPHPLKLEAGPPKEAGQRVRVLLRVVSRVFLRMCELVSLCLQL
jgi:hypothetical protein